MAKMLTITTLLLLVLLQTVQAEFAYFEYVREPLSPRVMAMGGAGTALFGGGYAYYNPAGAAFADSSFVAIDFGRQWGDLSRGSVETAWIFEKWFIGGTFLGRTVDYPLADETGVLPGSGAGQEAMFSLFTGWKNERYAIGVAGNGLPHFLAGENAFAFSASGGIAAIILPNKLTAGAALLHAGRLHRGFYSSKFSAHRDTMATTFRLGATLCDTIMKTLPVTLSVDAVYEQGESGVLVPFGLEVRPVETVTLRIGKQFYHQTDIFTYGIGLSWDNISFDAGGVLTSLATQGEKRDYETKWLMGLRYSIPRKTGFRKKREVFGDTTTITPAVEPEERQAVSSETIIDPAQELDTAAIPVNSVIKTDTLGSQNVVTPLVSTTTKDSTAVDQLPPVAPSTSTSTTSSSASESDENGTAAQDDVTDDKKNASETKANNYDLPTDANAKKTLPTVPDSIKSETK